MRIMRAMAAVVATVITGAPCHAGATTSGSNHMLSRMDTNKNGTVSREEYAQFLGHRDPTGRGFNYLDVNHNGKIENNELRRIYGPGWVESIGVNHPPKR